VEALLDGAGLALADVSTFLVCRGPGHLTGLRLCKMLVDGANAIGPGRPAISYDCLELAAQILQGRGRGDSSVAIAVSKRLVAVRSAKTSNALRFVPTATAPSDGAVFFLPALPPVPAGGIPFAPEPEEALPFFRKKLREGFSEESFSPVTPPAQPFVGPPGGGGARSADFLLGCAFNLAMGPCNRKYKTGL
jgi:hypothetical protein